MQSNLIIKNTVKQNPLYLYLQLIIMCKPVKCKIKYLSEYGSDVFGRELNIFDVFLNKKYF